ncbi:hypothetical protein IJJ49_01995 [Candidatus Saccharibacteria bacterium]|nr:hypothetical protein [Candidatus Saccharibacteria bacterium]
MIDIHTHILPGVDDGAENFYESIEIVKYLARQGVTDIIATPHYVNETEYTSERAENLRLFDALKRELAAAGVKTRIFLGSEIYIDPEILELIKTEKISPLAESKYLLVELPLSGNFPNYEDYFNDLILRGYKVILAHPERYETVQKNYEIIKDLREKGVLFQSNFGSILGKYGREAKKTVKKLAKDKLIFTFGSDTHRASRRDYITLARKKLLKYYSERELNYILTTNPGKILENK